MEAKITKRLVDQVQAGDKDQLVFDIALKGFALKVTPKGAKSYLVIYRMGGRETPKRKLKIGDHGPLLTADQARAEATRLLTMARQGTDPAELRKARNKRGITVSDLADRYLTEHVDVKNKPSTAVGFYRLVNTQIRPHIGKLEVEKIIRADIAAFHHTLRGTPRQANQTLAVLSKMFSLAEIWGLRPDGSNPCKRIERYRENKRERFLSNQEVERLGSVLAQVEASGEAHQIVCNAIRLLLLTGCRVGEILVLRWEDVTDTGLIIRDAKAGGRTHSIGALAQAFLAEMPRPSPWVFPAPQDHHRPLPNSTISHAWMKIRMKAELADTRLHDLRHTVGTFAGQTGANAFLIRDKLGHKTLAMTGRYVNKDDSPLRELSDRVESRITGALDAGAAAVEATDNVVALPAGKGRKRSG